VQSDLGPTGAESSGGELLGKSCCLRTDVWFKEQLHASIRSRCRCGNRYLGGHEAPCEIERSVPVRQELLVGGDVAVRRAEEQSLRSADRDVGFEAEPSSCVDLAEARHHRSQAFERSSNVGVGRWVNRFADHPSEVLTLDLFARSAGHLCGCRLHEVEAEHRTATNSSEKRSLVRRWWQCIHVVEQLTKAVLKQRCGRCPLKWRQDTRERLCNSRRREGIVRTNSSIESIVVRLGRDSRAR